jgi:hypothetical protein
MMEHCMRQAPIAAVLLGLLVTSAAARAEEALSLEGKLLVAELGNGTVDLVDLGAEGRLKQIVGCREPQGIAYARKTDLVASAGDGTVRFFRGDDLAAASSLGLGSDADNIRIDPRSGHLIVEYGSGSLAIIDPGAKSKIGDIKLKAHPESFQLDAASGRISVNVPDAGHIAVVDLAAAKQSANWSVSGLRANSRWR